MRICFLCQSLDTLGGLQRAVVLLANELVSRGEDVSVLMDGPQLKANPYGLSDRVRLLETVASGKPPVIASYVAKFRQHFGFPRPSVHNGHLSDSVIFSKEFDATCLCLEGGRFDFVVGCDPLHTVVAAYVCEELDAKACGWQHSTYDGYFHQRGRGYYGLEALYGAAVKRCDVNFVLTDESRIVYERETGHAAVVLPNSIASLGVRSRAESCVLYCGRLDPGSKGADYLPAIASGLASSGFEGRFEIVGDGPYRDELEQWVTSVDLPFRIKLAGFVANAAEYYSHASVLVSPSRWEGFGLSILEAMSHGVPCVAFDNDGPRSIITDGVDGFIVSNGSTDALVDKTMRLIRDDDARSHMGDRAVETARGYLVAAQADTFLAVLEGCGR